MTAATISAAPTQPLLEVEDLCTWFPVRRGVLPRVVGHVRAVDGVTLRVRERETLGLVGESGCGKSTLAQTVLRLVDPTRGSVRLRSADGLTYDVLAARGERLRDLRRQMQMIFQDAGAAMNPRFTVGQVVEEPLRIQGLGRARERRQRVAELLTAVGLRPSDAARFPRDFSGGQRQRIGIARALALRPRLLICDEPVSALDVSVQSQILNLLSEIRLRQGLTCLFIAHNLDVVRHMSDRVAVMYLGRIVELAPAGEIHRRPRHPYTEALLGSIPIRHPRARSQERARVGGDVPDPAHPPPGCTFHPRCPHAEERCRREVPALREVAPGWSAACHLSETLSLRGVVA